MSLTEKTDTRDSDEKVVEFLLSIDGADFLLTNERHFINMESVHKYGKCRSEGNKR